MVPQALLASGVRILFSLLCAAGLLPASAPAQAPPPAEPPSRTEESDLVSTIAGAILELTETMRAIPGGAGARYVAPELTKARFVSPAYELQWKTGPAHQEATGRVVIGGFAF